jgi:hypothetical protein
MTRTVIAAGTAANTHQYSTVIERQFNETALGVKLDYTGFNAADATIEVQESDDNITWYSNTGSIQTIPSGTGNLCFNLNGLSSNYYKVFYENYTNSAGTIKVTTNITK